MSFSQRYVHNVVPTQVESNMFDIRSKNLASAGGCLKSFLDRTYRIFGDYIDCSDRRTGPGLKVNDLRSPVLTCAAGIRV